jgi:hypothetical protein
VLSALPPPAPVLFNRANTLTFEQGTPADKETLSVDWSLGQFGATIRAISYGETIQPDNNPAFDHVMGRNTILDIEARFNVNDALTLSAGADNVFDEYPSPSLRAQFDRQHAVLKLLAVRLLRPLRLRESRDGLLVRRTFAPQTTTRREQSRRVLCLGFRKLSNKNPPRKSGAGSVCLLLSARA